MDYSTFIKETTLTVDHMNEAEKTACLQNLIRIADKDQFDQIWQIIVKDAQSDQLLTQEFNKWQKYLETIDALGNHFEAEVYQDDDYWDDEWKFRYRDYQKIGPQLNACASFADKLLLYGQYELARELYESLHLTSFYAYSEDMGEHVEVLFEDLKESNIITLDLRQFAKNYLYALYQTTPADDRPQEIFSSWSWLICWSLKLAELFAIGPEPLPESQRFLEDWITFLRHKSDQRATGMLLEAVKLSKTYADDSTLLELAKETSHTIPEIYLWLIEKLVQEKNFEQAFNTGKIALKDIPQNLPQRSRLAESMIKLVEEQHLAADTFEFLQESFFSLPTVDKLLQLLGKDLDKNQLHQLVEFVNTHPGPYQHVLLFFLQQFDTCFTKAARNKQALGWRASDKGHLIPLFLLLFTKNTGTPAAAALERELAAQIYHGDWVQFSAAFDDWKYDVQLDSAAKTKIFAWCQEEIKKREEALVQTKFRKHYGRAAALLITMGEAEEALGINGAAEKTWQIYYKKHFRKNNFRAAMRDLHTQPDAEIDLDDNQPNQIKLW